MLGVKNSWDYPAAKGGVLGFTRSLAVTAQPHNITVNAIMLSCAAQRCGRLTIEEVASNWDEVIDIEHAQLMRHSRDESAMYRGRAQWQGSNAGYQ